MARCGRCALYAKFPEGRRETTVVGCCLWFRYRFVEDEVYEPRKCPKFIEWIPGWDQHQHWAYVNRLEDLGTMWTESRRALLFSAAALFLSIFSAAYGLLR